MRIDARALVLVPVLSAGLNSLAGAQLVRIEGSSAGSGIASIAAHDLQRTKKGAPLVSIGVSGSETALSRLCANQIDIANTARPILKEELSACGKAGVEFIELPVAFDSVTIVVNARNTFVQGLTLAELRLMWGEKAQGKIVRWSQINPRFPNAPLKLLGPDMRYERAGIFSEAVLGPGQRTRHDYMTSVDDNILVEAVARDVYALSYLSYATYLGHRGGLKPVPIVSEGAGTRPEGDNALARPLFLYVNVKSLQQTFAREFVEFTVFNGERFASTAGYQPLTRGTYKLGLEHLRKSTRGTAWDGTVPVGTTPSGVERRMSAL